MLKEFKEFASRGNIMDMAIGVVLGGAFQKIISSLVEDIIMPAISMITGKVDFSDMVFRYGEVTIKYGNFITAIVDFLIIAFSIFLAVTYINKINEKMEKMKLGEHLVDKIDKKGKFKKKSEEVIEPTIKICPYCFSEINYKAVKCPHCTSDLETAKEEVSEESTSNI